MTPTAAQTVRELIEKAKDYRDNSSLDISDSPDTPQWSYLDYLNAAIEAAEALLAREEKEHSSFSPACASADRYAFRRHVKKILSNLDMNTHD